MADSTIAALTALSVLDGNELLYAVDDPSGTPLDRKVTANQLREGLLPPGLFSLGGGTANGYLGPPPGSTVGAAAQLADRLYQHLICVPSDMTLTELSIDVTVAAAGNARLGIYNCRSHSNGLPGTLILDAGTVSVNVTNTLQRITGLSQFLKRGWYSVAYVCDVTPTVIRINNGQGGWLPYGSGVTSSGGAIRTFSYAALPADESAQSYQSDNATAIFAKGTFA